jgi:hypothetical protein
MELRFKMIFLRSNEEVAVVEGIKATDGDYMTVNELQQVPAVEAFLEKLLGLRVHIEVI